MGFDDLANLRALLADPRLRVLLGRQRTIALCPLRLQSLRVDVFGAGRRRRLAMTLLGLFTNDLGHLVLLDQARFEQLILQWISHTNAA